MKKIRIFFTKQDGYSLGFKDEAKKMGLKPYVYFYENFSFEDNKLVYVGRKDFPKFTSDDVVIFRRCGYEKVKQYFWVRLLATLARDAGARVINGDFMVNFPLHSGKLFQAAYFSDKNIPHVSTYRLNRKLKEAAFPMIIKKRYSAFGKDSHLVETNAEFLEVKSKIKNKNDYIIQKYSPLSRDIRVIILNNKFLKAVSRKVVIHEDRHVGVKVTGEVELSSEERKIVDQVLEVFDLDIAGLDLFTDENNKTWLGEMNFFPNFAGFTEKTGINMFQLILKMIV